ncbi:unnamed protein product, partial [Rotaria sp. Silwood2]
MDVDGSEGNEDLFEDDSNDDSKDNSEDDSEDNSEDDSEDNSTDDSEDDSEGDGECSSSDEDDSDDDENDNKAMLQSSLIYNAPWTTNFCPRSVREFQKSRKCFDVLPSSSIQTFKRLFCDKVFNLILEQTNIYGRQNNAKAGDMTRWIDITKSQLEKFIGINIIMGYCRNPSIDSYWSTDESFRNERISTSMPRNIFKRILGNIHLVDNSHAEEQKELASDKLYKVSNFLKLLKYNFQTHFDLGEKLTIDEMMIKFKGRSSLKQYIKQKPIKRGYKVWVLADTSTGYVYNFEIYSGKSVERQTPLAEHVVWSLTRELSMKFHHLYFDNFFTLPLLVEQLLSD